LYNFITVASITCWWIKVAHKTSYWEATLIMVWKFVR